MIRRFCLYGFLKNQRYFEPFIILAFLEKGLSFLDIGLLVGFREVAAIILEIPSGAVADVFGRRRSMVFSFSAYILSFLVFALASTMAPLLLAMLFFAVGDAFRTGTHKAMIFQWLALEDRLDDRTRVYGFTRSWSKIGSAVSSLVAAALVFISGNFTIIFWLSMVPYALNLVNFLGYPRSLEGDSKREVNLGAALKLTGQALRQTFTHRPLATVISESMLLEGTFKVTKDYLQPVLQALALGLSIPLLNRLLGGPLTDDQRSALLVGMVFFVYFILMGVASRHAHRWVRRLGSEEKLTRLMWVFNLLVFTAMGWALWQNMAWLAVLAFIGLGMIQNTFRPAQISRIDSSSSAEMGATILSIESQSKSLAAAVLAPLLGWLVDSLTTGSAAMKLQVFWPVAALGVLVSLLVVLVQVRTCRPRF